LDLFINCNAFLLKVSYNGPKILGSPFSSAPLAVLLKPICLNVSTSLALDIPKVGWILSKAALPNFLNQGTLIALVGGAKLGIKPPDLNSEANFSAVSFLVEPLATYAFPRGTSVRSKKRFEDITSLPLMPLSRPAIDVFFAIKFLLFVLYVIDLSYVPGV